MMSLDGIRIEHVKIDPHLEMSRISVDGVGEKSQQLIYGKEPNFILFLNDGSTLSIHVELLIEYSYRFIDLLKSGELFDVSDYDANAIRELISFLYNGYMTVHLNDIDYLLYVAGRIKLRICREALSQYLVEMSARSLEYALYCAEIISLSHLNFCAEYSAALRQNILDVIEHSKNLNILYEVISIGGIKEILFALQIHTDEKRTRLALVIANSWLQAGNRRFAYAESLYALVSFKNLSIQELIEMSETSKQQLPNEIYTALLRQLKEAVYDKHLGIEARNIRSTLTFESQISIREAQPSPEMFDEILLPEGISKSLTANVCQEQTIAAVDKASHPSMNHISSGNISEDTGFSSSTFGNSHHHRQFLTAKNRMSPETPTYAGTNFSPSGKKLTAASTKIVIDENDSKNTWQKSKGEKQLDQKTLAHSCNPLLSKKQIASNDFKDSEAECQKVENLRLPDYMEPRNVYPSSIIQTVQHNHLTNATSPYGNREQPKVITSTQPKTLAPFVKESIIKHDNSTYDRDQFRKYGNSSETTNLTKPSAPIMLMRDDKPDEKISFVSSLKEASEASKNGLSSTQFNYPPTGSEPSFNGDDLNENLSHNVSDDRHHRTTSSKDATIQRNFKNGAGKLETMKSVDAALLDKSHNTYSSATNRNKNTNIWMASNKEKQLPIVCSTATQISLNGDSLISSEKKIKQPTSMPHEASSSSVSLNRIQNAPSISTANATEKDTSTARSSCSVDDVIRSAVSASHHDHSSKLKYLDAEKRSVKKSALTNSQLSGQLSPLIGGDVDLVGISQEWQRQPSGGNVRVTSATVVRYPENQNASSSTSLSSLQLANSITNMKYDLESLNKPNGETSKQQQLLDENNKQERRKAEHRPCENDKVGVAKAGAKEFNLKTAVDNRKTSTLNQNTKDDPRTAKEVQKMSRKHKSSQVYSSSSNYKPVSHNEMSGSSESENVNKTSTSKRKENDPTNGINNSDHEENDEGLKTVRTTSSLTESDLLEKTTSSSFSI
uniref:BTB domain-containing protein n=1 Tax=Parascaris univalens TaxID=6257 RepID=A0A914ZTT3_PARUN